ncbi:MAG: leucine-rich repeat domain-containing protein, partial [Clostridia bacterium]|nr:leucine-rich repeat domain-containing protein [Clostridia bacterium]
MGKDELGHDCGALQPTDDGYFTFTLLSDGTYEIKARDRKNIPAKVVLPSTYNGIPVTSIGEGAFVRYSSLTSINIPDSVTSIRNYAFSFCSRLTSIVIPDSVTSIGDEAFSDCYSLTSINVSANNMNYKSIDGNLYSKDGKTLIQYAIGKTATAFTIPDSVTSIGDWAFGGCSGLTSVTIGNSVTSIGYGAFYGCSSLTSITIPDSVTSIGDGAFYGCSSLMSINVSANNMNYKSIDGNLYSKDGKTLIQYAKGKTATAFTI